MGNTQPLSLTAPGGAAVQSRQQQPTRIQGPYFDDEYSEALTKWLGTDDEDASPTYNLSSLGERQRNAQAFSDGYEADDGGYPDDQSPQFSSMQFMHGAEEPPIHGGKRRGTRQSRRRGKINGSTISSDMAVPPSQQYCKFFQTGSCTRGDQCKYLHRYAPGAQIPTLLPPPSLIQPQQRLSPQQSQPPPPQPQPQQQQPQQQQQQTKQPQQSQQQQIPDAVPGMIITPNSQSLRRTSPGSGYRPDFIPQFYDPPRPALAKSSSIPPGLMIHSSSSSLTRPDGFKPITPMWGSEPMFSLPPTTSPATTDTVSGSKGVSSSSDGGRVPLSPPPLSSFIGHFVEMSLDQNGSRHLQHQFDIATDDLAVGVVLNETLPQLSRLSCDPIAGYMCQKMMEKANHKQRLAIIESLKPNACDVCCNVHGTRTIQKLANRLESDDEIAALRQMLCPWVLDLVQNANGNPTAKMSS